MTPNVYLTIPSGLFSRNPLDIATNRRPPFAGNDLAIETAIQRLSDIFGGDGGVPALAGRSGVIKLSVIDKLQVLVEYLDTLEIIEKEKLRRVRRWLETGIDKEATQD
jgi:hypothetical protein